LKIPSKGLFPPELELYEKCQVNWGNTNVRLHTCDELVTGAGQWWAAKLHIHWPDPTKASYTLLFSGENSIHIGASRLLLMPWLSVQNAQVSPR